MPKWIVPVRSLAERLDTADAGVRRHAVIAAIAVAALAVTILWLLIGGGLAGSLSDVDVTSRYAAIVLGLGAATGMSDSLLHVHAGMLVLLATRVITGRSLSTPLPLAMVAVAEVANEVIDRLHYGSWRWPDTSLDIVNTLFWPTILFIGLKLRHPR